ncbi:MAG TPA: polysaccharide biosynthesis/export family protein [Pyrinomonadaceae bacterium]|nr:polysaccharide biosynthesis/export family protein [Pyrinomonadaceae bacterium]
MRILKVNRRHLTLRFFFTLLLISAAGAQAVTAQTAPQTAAPTAAAAAPDNRYRIGPGDVLDIRVYNRPQLSREAVRVDGRGMIRMPLIEGEIKAACLAESELSALISERYKKFYRNLHVDVFVKEFQSEPVAVIGAVNTPGRFQLQRRVRLLELLAFANGPAERAGRAIHVVHAGTISVCEAPGAAAAAAADAPDAVKASFVSYNLSETLRGEEGANPFVRPGDIITLPEAEQIYVVGNVISPRAIALKEPLTVTRAIAMAGGAMRDTKTDRVRVIRQLPGTTTKTEIFVNLKAIEKRQATDLALQANDIVDVPVSEGKSILRSLVGAVIPSVAQMPVRVIP